MKIGAKALITRFLLSERGSVESTLVLVPLLVLFLGGMQISYAAHARNISRMHAQEVATESAINGSFTSNTEILRILSSGRSQNLDLAVTRERGSLATLLPPIFLGENSSRAIDIAGLAIVENRR